MNEGTERHDGCYDDTSTTPVTEPFIDPKVDYVNRVVKPASGDTLLHVSSEKGDMAALGQLIVSNQSGKRNNDTPLLEVANLDGKRPLHFAAQSGQVDTAQLLLDSGAQVDSLKRADWTPLMMACTKRSLNMIRLLIEKGKANVELKNKDGWTAFHLASRQGHLDIISYFVNMFGDSIMDTRSTTNRTPLHTAALHGHVYALSLLLSTSSSQVNAMDSCGTTPLMDACRSLSLDTCIVLIENGADASLCDHLGRSALHVAAEAGAVDCVKYFVQRLGFSVDQAARETGLTSLHIAAREGNILVIQLLLHDLKANSNSTDAYGRTAKDIAFKYKKMEAVNLLTE
ncbi:Ankyrin repeat domain-containing protein 16 [Halotydeus destructor]|nr:Ankyrin repeat domain-containing protein 16 [Halotydeus destructor]